MNKGKLGGIVTFIASVLMIGAVKIWAPVCPKTLELASGGECHMRCFYYGQVMLYMGILLLAEAIVLFLSKQAHTASIIVIITSILMLLITNSNIGIGVCEGSAMMCHATAMWGRIGAIIAIVGAIITIPVKKSTTPQAR